MFKPHAAQHVRRLAELNVLVADDLDAVAPGIEEIEEPAGQHLDPGCRERLAHRLFVIDDQPKMSPVVARLLTTLLQGDELVTKIDECGLFALSSQLEVEQAAVKRQGLFDIAAPLASITLPWRSAVLWRTTAR